LLSVIALMLWSSLSSWRCTWGWPSRRSWRSGSRDRRGLVRVPESEPERKASSTS
jgi:hypothetical protein